MFINFPEINVPCEGIENMPLPKMVKISQTFTNDKIEDIKGHIRAQMEKNVPNKNELAGKRICITAGSRGIPNIDIMVREMCDFLKDYKAEPFIIPSMGSHGGANAEGQIEVLKSYNITEESMGVPILSSMEVVQYDTLDGIPLYCDKYAMESDGIVIFNKVKPHTDFRGKHESGLAKMMAIGIAKHKGAAMFHSFGFQSFTDLIPRVAEKFLEKCPFAFGVGVVQNAYDFISDIEVCGAEDMMEMDGRLQQMAKDKMARFKFDDIDVLIIDEIGKNISGNGHDPNVTGRNITRTFDGKLLQLKKIFIRGLTEESHHNGSGLGAADITTRECLNSVDWEATWTNSATTGVLNACPIPMYANTEEEAIRICIRTLHNVDFSKAKFVHIKNTLELYEFEVSESMYEAIKGIEGINRIDANSVEMKFDNTGKLVDTLGH